MHTSFVFNPEPLIILSKLAIAMLCGIIIGTERIISHKAAGMRTYALVAMGASLFVILGQSVLYSTNNPGAITAIIQGIITGVGFMCAGTIILRDGTSVMGLTTASGLWVASGIGMACGFGLFVPALLTTFLTLFILIIMYHVEKRVKDISPHESLESQNLDRKL